MKKHSKGFSLIELLVVIAILGIIASIAIPEYRSTVRRTSRADAQTALTMEAAAQERFYSQNRTYSTAIQTGATSTEGYYTISVVSADVNSFNLQAVPVAGGAQADDTVCAVITYSSAGTKAPAECW